MGCGAASHWLLAGVFCEWRLSNERRWELIHRPGVLTRPRAGGPSSPIMPPSHLIQLWLTLHPRHQGGDGKSRFPLSNIPFSLLFRYEMVGSLLSALGHNRSYGSLHILDRKRKENSFWLSDSAFGIKTQINVGLRSLPNPSRN